MSFFETIRIKLGSLNALPSLAVLGFVSGLLSGGVVVLFRLSIEGVFFLWNPSGQGSDFENTSWLLRLIVPSIGGFVVGALLYRASKDLRQMGVTYVLERMMFHQGYLSWKNAALQFIIGGLTLGSGQSVGREGPGIHLGSAASSWVGQKMKLPNNSIRILVGCGTAAAISASYNTPLAGVIFAMEVVMMEYTVSSFIPLILSSVTAAIMSRLVFGNDVAFSVPPLELKSLMEIPTFVVLGLTVGIIASSFILTTGWIRRRSTDIPIWLKCGIAGVLVGIIGTGIPEIMGIGYDTVNLALHGHLAFTVLALALVGKFLATAICSGLSMPGGGVGPSMFIGAMTGSVIGSAALFLFPDNTSQYSFYAIIGMATMMSAILQAPLAALLALLELTSNPNILLPGMIAVVVGNLVVSQVFKLPSLFLAPLKEKGLKTQVNALSQYLRSVSVAGVMERNIAVHERYIKFDSVDQLLEKAPRWILIKEDGVPKSLMSGNDLARYLLEKRFLDEQNKSDTQDSTQDDQHADLDLINIPADRQEIASIYLQGNLEEALDTMERENVKAVYIYRTTGVTTDKIYGILTKKEIESHYSYKSR